MESALLQIWMAAVTDGTWPSLGFLTAIPGQVLLGYIRKEVDQADNQHFAMGSASVTAFRFLP